MHYRLNSPAVAAQILDGEALVIHFTAGSYYSFDRVGSAVMELLVERQDSIDRVVEQLVHAFPTAADAIPSAVESFVAGLEAEGILARHSAPGSTPPAETLSLAGGWEKPTFTKYSDLSDLLRLDPIHDVDEAGWPVPRADASAP